MCILQDVVKMVLEIKMSHTKQEAAIGLLIDKNKESVDCFK